MSRFAQVSADNLAAANRMIPQVPHHDRADVSAIVAFRGEV
jgi:pyruvate dehydrogenase E2 component (dihydrolipoamide acetyltransferase)